jgi:tetratricopeptide (TPR) repeat protein
MLKFQKHNINSLLVLPLFVLIGAISINAQTQMTVREYVQSATDYAIDEQYEEAIELLEEAIEVYSKEPALYARLGAAKFAAAEYATGKYKTSEIVADLRKAAKLYRERGENEKARSVMQSVSQMQQENKD